MVLMVGIELKYFGDQLKPTNEIVRKYIFCDYSFVAFSLFRCSNWHLHNAAHPPTQTTQTQLTTVFSFAGADAVGVLWPRVQHAVDHL